MAPERSSSPSSCRQERLARAQVEQLAAELARRHIGAAASDEADTRLSDVANAVLDLEALGQHNLIHTFLTTWVEESGAFDTLAALRLHVAAGASPLRAMIITHGLSGAGKTTLARELAGAIGAIVVRNDVEHVRLRRERAARGDHSVLTLEVLRERLELLATQTIAAGWPVIVESCFLSRADREHFRAKAVELDAQFIILECAAPLSAIRERLSRRLAFGSLFHGDDASDDAVERALRAQLVRLEPLDQCERASTLTIDTDGPIDHSRIARLIERI